MSSGTALAVVFSPFFFFYRIKSARPVSSATEENAQRSACVNPVLSTPDDDGAVHIHYDTVYGEYVCVIVCALCAHIR